jgi:hypothetical protein
LCEKTRLQLTGKNLLRREVITWFSDFLLQFPSDMEKPNARGPSPSRKAHRALGQILNRKPKRLPGPPAKKIASNTGRAAGR